MTQQRNNQFSLLRTKRFAPLFVTQFLGAFNDNIFKNVFILLITFHVASLSGSRADMLINLAAGLFILPFFLFSALAGQMADKFEKSKLIFRIKFLEILIMAGAFLGFWLQSIPVLFFLLFLMGTQSAFFGPVKYSILPQHLKPDEMVGGNALVGTGTFIAILLGTILSGYLILSPSTMLTGSIVLIVAIGGWLASLMIPKAEGSSPDLKISYNLLRQTQQNINTARASKPVYLCILGLSWFWFLGACYLTQFPQYTLKVLNGSETIVTLLLACFSIGIGAGSLLCERLSGSKIELGLVPLGALGITLFGIDFSLATIQPVKSELLTISDFFHSTGSLRIIADLIFIGVFGGFFTVPLSAYIQSDADKKSRARIISAGNVMNALFMVGSAIFGFVLLGVFQLPLKWFFFILAILNFVVAGYIFTLIPRFFIRFIVWLLSRFMYRFNNTGQVNIPKHGSAVIVSNHVSFVDWLLITSACRRPIRFVMYEPFYRLPVLNLLFKWVKAIPIDAYQRNPKICIRAFREISKALENGELVCIFPEGKLTSDGNVDVFKAGIEKIIKINPVPVIPMAIHGMWGSFFSRKNGHAMRSLPKRFFSKINLNIGLPVGPDYFELNRLRNQVVLLNSGTSMKKRRLL